MILKTKVKWGLGFAVLWLMLALASFIEGDALMFRRDA